MIPRVIEAAIERYEKQHLPPGSFLRAVLENDLFYAAANSDPTNRPILADIVFYVDQHLQPHMWGTAEKVKAWLSQRS